MRIVGTGMTGFLGSWTLDLLLRRGHHVVALHRTESAMGRIANLLGHSRLEMFNMDTTDLGRAFESGCDAVLHCATSYGRSQFDPKVMIEANIVLPLRLLALSAERGVGCFVNTDTILDKGISSYALSKHQFGQWLDAYSDRVNSVSVAFEHFYGGMDDPSKFTSYVIGSLCAGAKELALTPGRQRRYFMHVRDASLALVTVVESKMQARGNAGHERMDVGAQESMELRDFVLAAWTAAGCPSTDLRFSALPYRESEIMDPILDLEPMQKLGWSAKVGIQDGLLQAIRQQRSGDLTPAHGDFE